MKEYVSPSLVDLDITETAEGIFAGSGSEPEITPAPGDSPAPQGCWGFTCTWVGHNSGGHSICEFKAVHAGDHSGDTLTMNVMTNFPIKAFGGTSGTTITNIGKYNFTIIRQGHFNENDNVVVNIEIIAEEVYYDANNNPLHGAIGLNNIDKYYCTVTSYVCS